MYSGCHYVTPELSMVFRFEKSVCQASKTAFRSHCARPTVSEASCPNFEPRAHARLT